MAGREWTMAGGQRGMGAAGLGAGRMGPGGRLAWRRRGQEGIYCRARRRIQIHREATGRNQLMAWRY